MMLSPEVGKAITPARIRWDDPPCPLCGGERRSPVFEAPDHAPGGSGFRFAVVRCSECGLHFTCPRPDPETIRQFYLDRTRPDYLPEIVAGRTTHLDYLERAHDPLALLAAVRRRLPPGGKLAVTVPNFDGPGYRWFGSNWIGLDLPRRLTHFTPATLLRMLERGGFRVTSVRRVRMADWLRASAEMAVCSGRATLWQRSLTFGPLAALAAWSSSLTGRADGLLATARQG